MRAVAEAPGKVIVSGEHFVVHGGLALSAAIERVVRVEASRFEGLRVDSSAYRERPFDQTSLPVARMVRAMYDRRSVRPAVSLSISSELPPAAGLGSSGSTMVAAAAAVSRLEGWGLDLESLIRTATVGERMVHGSPSGVDVATSAMGGVIMFRMGEEPRRLELTEGFSFVVAHSGRRRSTGRLISKVSRMRESYPHLFKGLCDSSTLFTQLAAERLLDGDTEGLGRLLTYSHAVLGRVGASSEPLDELVDACLAAGSVGAKLTGAGGGGSVLAVARRGEERSLAERLSLKGYGVFVTEIPCGGVRAWVEGQ